MKTDVRYETVQAALWGVAHNHWATYSEGPDRMLLVKRPYVYPFCADCSSDITAQAAWADGEDPNGFDFDGYGYTGSIVANKRNKLIPLEEVHAGDILIFGPGTGWHAVRVVSVEGAYAKNPLTVSMGRPGAPELVTVNEDGRLPQRYYRPSTKKRHNITAYLNKRIPKLEEFAKPSVKRVL